jgi:hypothetical protein
MNNEAEMAAIAAAAYVPLGAVAGHDIIADTSYQP